MPALLQTLLLEAFETDGRIADVWTDPNPMAASYLLETVVRAFTARYDDAATTAPVVEVSLDLRLVRLAGHQTDGRTLITEQHAAARNDLWQYRAGVRCCHRKSTEPLRGIDAARDTSHLTGCLPIWCCRRVRIEVVSGPALAC